MWIRCPSLARHSDEAPMQQLAPEGRTDLCVARMTVRHGDGDRGGRGGEDVCGGRHGGRGWVDGGRDRDGRGGEDVCGSRDTSSWVRQ